MPGDLDLYAKNKTIAGLIWVNLLVRQYAVVGFSNTFLNGATQ